MGCSYYALVIYGVPETKKMVTARRKRVPRPRRLCPQGHYRNQGLQSAWKVCPQCGSEPLMETVYKDQLLDPRDHYAPDDAPDDWHLDWVHLTGPDYDNGVYLGILLLEKDESCDGGSPIPQPTEEQKLRVASLLERIGYKGDPPQSLLVTRYM